MDELSPQARALLDRVKANSGPTAEQRAQMLSHVVQVAPATAVASTTTTATSSMLMRVVSALLVSAVIITGIVLLLREAHDAPRITARAVQRHATSEPTRAQTATPVATPSPAPSVVPIAATEQPRISAEAPEHDALLAEVRLLESAKKAVEGGLWTRAQRLLTQHQSRFEDGSMKDERQVLQAIVLCSNGERDAGRTLAARYANSPWRARLQSACEVNFETP